MPGRSVGRSIVVPIVQEVKRPGILMMSEHEFELEVEGADLTREETVQQLYGAGLDDATFASSDGRVLISVAREADTFTNALLSAIQQVESVSGVRVLRVTPD